MPLHVTEFLLKPDQHELGPIVVLHGDDRYMKQEAIHAIEPIVLGEEEDTSITRFDGKRLEKELPPSTLFDELKTVSMWGDQRLVIVDDAEKFVSAYRAQLEKYLDAPSKSSLLILDVKSWNKSTKLAKRVAKIGLDLECKELKGSQLAKWISDTAEQVHQKQISRDAALLLVELVGTHCGQIHQELAKLATFVGEAPRISPDDIRAVVGGWKAETTWAMTDALRDGNVGDALKYLDNLLVAGEAPQKILGGLNFVWRKYFKATQLAVQGTPLRQALKESGVFPRDIESSDRYLRRLTRQRAEKIGQWLLTADLNLKGNSRLDPRLELEQLLFLLSGCA
ncbi:DNA polymerase III subunit delta [Gimesia panareensis]|uniref:DNA polymerase III subunit delta n=1 Tax=Gimesia panareensis TaxID=2527978 RepID=A0A517QBP5_9PLAN|nr:DNA polymerase III subunit delta [Gimesia panareensis]QDT29051.1 DNA polymerase III subunit delta [Gimesia panareensis]QDU51903.1 DNA polymerase III subunit delta [Gimesia panareensis]QDV19848.1 DNA polymerase III subunit delta [Gimesia panareensis]